MDCQRCGGAIGAGEEREFQGQMLCEDCYMDALSPSRPCDPWAVHAAKSLTTEGHPLTDSQKKILAVLRETKGIEPAPLAERVGLSMKELERDIATLRHMEKLRATLRENKRSSAYGSLLPMAGLEEVVLFVLFAAIVVK